MKKLAYATVLVVALSSSVSFAGGPTVEPIAEHHCSWTGFYAGLGGGGVFSDFDTKNVDLFSVSPGTTTAQLQTTTHIGDVSGFGTLFLGYGYDFDHFYLGVEGFGSYGQPSGVIDIIPSVNFDGTTYQVNTHANVHLNSGEGGIDGRVGLFATSNNTLIYARIGAAFNDITVHSVSSFSSSDGAFADLLSASASKSVTGLRLGVGIEEMLKQCFGLRMDYIYTDYGKFTVPAITTTLANGDSVTHSGSVDVSTNAVLGSVVYHFSA